MCCKCYKISPPPKEKGNFRVVYVVDVNASGVLEAATLTHQMMTGPDSILPVLDVMDCQGKVTTVDLSK
jgi:hypothetical protein